MGIILIYVFLPVITCFLLKSTPGHFHHSKQNINLYVVFLLSLCDFLPQLISLFSILILHLWVWVGNEQFRPCRGNRDVSRGCPHILYSFPCLKALNRTTWFGINRWACTDLELPIEVAKAWQKVKYQQFTYKESSSYLPVLTGYGGGCFCNTVPWHRQPIWIGV